MGSITAILNSRFINDAMVDIEVRGYFLYKPFFLKTGVSSKHFREINTIFEILDTDKSGFIEVAEVRTMMRSFQPGARDLTPAETADFMKAGDPNGTGKISPDAFAAMVRSSNQQD